MQNALRRRVADVISSENSNNNSSNNNNNDNNTTTLTHEETALCKPWGKTRSNWMTSLMNRQHKTRINMQIAGICTHIYTVTDTHTHTHRHVCKSTKCCTVGQQTVLTELYSKSDQNERLPSKGFIFLQALISSDHSYSYI